jgi:hypothetical protein
MALRGVNSSSGVPLGGAEQSKAPTESKTTFFGGLLKTVKYIGNIAKGVGGGFLETGAKLASVVKRRFTNTQEPPLDTDL